ncbi:hypothetical protein M2138_001268 [Dysgonomonadaceae bacterium PH5-43]|nr:hypothetical protein [Dysgonomonadaceae bacterium PH5-43]
MKNSFFKKSMLIASIAIVFSFLGANAQSQDKVYAAEDIIKEKLEVIKEALNLTDDQVVKIKAIDKQTEQKLEEAPNNTAAKKVYKWRDGEYKKVLTAEQFKVYLKKQQEIVDEAQATWMQSHGTEV